MILIHTASHLEAKPLIAHFGLKRNLRFGRFELYLNKSDLHLIISGIGKLAAASAVSSALTYLELNKKLKQTSRVINYGLAGATEDIPLKEFFLINQIKDNSTNKNYHPDVLFKSQLKQKSLSTFDQPVSQKDFPELANSLVDMEGSAVFHAASKWLTADRIHLFKVTADHLSCQEFKENQPKKLIADHAPKLILIINEFLKEEKQEEKIDWQDSPEVNQIADDLKISENQLEQLIKSIEKYETCCELSFREFFKDFHYKVSEHKSINSKTFSRLMAKLSIEVAKATDYTNNKDHVES